MKYIVFDLEFNQKLNSEDKIPELPFEIIQIGALKLDENFNTISSFNKLIKPTLYKSIHPYIRELTKITDEMVSTAKEFHTVYSDFLNFIGEDYITFITWGTTDLRELYRNITYFKLQSDYLSKNYIDIQEHASNHFNAPVGARIGLRNIIDFLSIPITGEFHDAFNDAYYTAEVFKILYNDSIEIKTYKKPTIKKVTEPKKVVDYPSLINQFEKMYNKKLTLQEIDMIKLAYIMGKTNQFLIPLDKKTVSDLEI